MGLSSILKELLVATTQTRRPLSFFSPSSLPPWPRPRQTQPCSTPTPTVATTADLVPTPTPMATAPTHTLPTLTPVAATMPALLSHALTVALPATLLPRGRPTLTQPTLSAPTLLNTDSQGPSTETVWSTPLTTASAPTTSVNRSHAKNQVVD